MMTESRSDLLTAEQRAKFHAMCRDLANQCEWAGGKMSEQDWKLLVLASAHGQRVVPNLFGDGFVVMNNSRTRDMLKPVMSELLEQIQYFGDSRGVLWTDPKEVSLRKEYGQ
jgi:hypothetical protein